MKILCSKGAPNAVCLREAHEVVDGAGHRGAHTCWACRRWACVPLRAHTCRRQANCACRKRSKRRGRKPATRFTGVGGSLWQGVPHEAHPPHCRADTCACVWKGCQMRQMVAPSTDHWGGRRGGTHTWKSTQSARNRVGEMHRAAPHAAGISGLPFPHHPISPPIAYRVRMGLRSTHLRAHFTMTSLHASQRRSACWP